MTLRMTSLLPGGDGVRPSREEHVLPATVAVDPGPVQLPHPPIWVGGTSRASRVRVARFGAGWSPLMPSEAFSRTVRSAPMDTFGDEVIASAADRVG
jgi:alkanesulfonate monooxygenase SsuD/methylene tetrahydromethanopterin reductase-like flavin-dependent oxidoreductase (luciferase family)